MGAREQCGNHAEGGLTGRGYSCKVQRRAYGGEWGKGLCVSRVISCHRNLSLQSIGILIIKGGFIITGGGGGEN